MTSEYPKMLYAAAGRGSVTVRDAAEEAKHLEAGYSLTPGEAHRGAVRFHAPDMPAGTGLTEAHIPLIVDQVTEAVFDRLKGMAVAATEGEAHRDALHDGLDARFAALRDDLLGGISALIAAPTPAPVSGKKA